MASGGIFRIWPGAIGAFGLISIGPAPAPAQRLPERPFPASKVDDRYVPGPDSRPQPGVPKGEILSFDLEGSRVFPGSSRRITVYVPAQYRADAAAALYVGLDDLQFEAATVFDNLIARGEMPVTIAIGVQAGIVPSRDGAGSNPRFNRSREFDALDDALCHFLVEEVIPAVESRRTGAGLPIRVTRDPNLRAAGGMSTGGIAAFTLAFRHPEQFRRIFSAIGTFVAMRGGDGYPALVRKTEPRPIRIFLQDGANDQLDSFIGEVGNWWLANQQMESALSFAGYDVAHLWGEGSHSPKHPSAIFPEAMRWLWRDWTMPIAARATANVVLKEVLVAGEEWRPVAAGAGGVSPLPPRGRRRIARSLVARNLVVDSSGRLYALARTASMARDALWFIPPKGRPILVDERLEGPAAIALSADRQWLAVFEQDAPIGYSYRVAADGRLDARQSFYRLEQAGEDRRGGATGLAVDRDGLWYAATPLGVQILDRNGRARAILPVPGGGAVDLAFGGEDLRTLFVRSANGLVYARRLAATGAPAWAPPSELPS